MSEPIQLALLWHMHQPLYRVGNEHVCAMPWVRLHSIRSYYDMVRVLDEFPGIHVTINLVPSLIEQIRAYENGASDLFWETGSIPAASLTDEHKRFLFRNFFTAQEHHLIRPIPAFSRLFEKRNDALHTHGPDEAWRAFSVEEFRDLQAVFDLAWFGFMACEDFPRIRQLRQKPGFTQQDVDEIHGIEKDIIARILGLYQKAAKGGRLEIATSPYFHPIIPLVIDSDSAREALPQAPLPRRFSEPEDAREQIESGLDYVEQELGLRPIGIWPSEGSVSDAAAKAFADAGAKWCASDEEVLSNSERAGGHNASAYRLWSVDAAGGDFTIVFRDHDLSDRIGFRYQSWHARDAVGDLLEAARHHVRKFHRNDRLVLIALDGENPWEHYPDAGSHFLRELYDRIDQSSEFEGCSVGQVVAAAKSRARIERLRPGSWIYGNFGTWIGGPQKNHAWEVLGDCRDLLRDALSRGTHSEDAVRRARHSLLAAEGSDWMWWLDGQFASEFIPEFDRLFRAHLSNAFEALDLEVPEVLSRPLAEIPGHGGGAPLQAPLALLDPTIDGTSEGDDEWVAAQRLAWPHLREQTTMARAARVVNYLWFGFSERGDFCLRLDPAEELREGFTGLNLCFTHHGTSRTLSIKFGKKGKLESAKLSLGSQGTRPRQDSDVESQIEGLLKEILELRFPAELAGLLPGEFARLDVELHTSEGTEKLRAIDIESPHWDSEETRA